MEPWWSKLLWAFAISVSLLYVFAIRFEAVRASHVVFSEVTCPLVAPADTVVSCPGWKDRKCRVRKAASGLLARSSASLLEFRVRYGFKKGRPGFVIDHMFPLACGGCDVPWNMAWQTKADGRAKDRWERNVCKGAALPNDRENEAVWQ